MGSAWAHSFGVALMGRQAPGRVTTWARAAERAGLGSVWIVEDYFFPGAFGLAGACAAVTERVAIGLGVVNPFTRHPAVVAMETATIAGMAPGRVVLGLGTSNRHWIEEQMGLPFKTPLVTLREGVGVVRRLLAGQRVTHEGSTFTLRDASLELAPDAPVPILLGVKAPKALALAGAIADGLHCSMLASPAHVRRVRTITTTAYRDAGRVGAFPVIAYVPMAVSRDRGQARSRVAPLLARYLGVLHGQSIVHDGGLDDVDTLPFRQALLYGEPATARVTEAMIDTYAIAGTPDDCRTSLRRWAEAGLDAPVAVPVPGPDVEEQIELYGRELAPYWHHARRDLKDTA